MASRVSPPPTSMSSNPITIREATPDDVPSVVRLLRLRDEREHPAEAVASYVCRLNPQRLRGWIAFAGDEPAGMTTLYVRGLRCGDRRLTMGYWAHLFIRPEYRRTMIYPQLLMTMMKSSKTYGLDLIGCVMRRDQVTESHLKLGYREAGTLPVLMLPLRPARLLARHRRWGAWAQAIGAPMDGLYRMISGGRSGAADGVAAHDAPFEDDAAAKLAGQVAVDGRDRIGHEWSADVVQERYANTIEGWPYTLMRAGGDGRPEASLVFRVAERGRGIRAGVILDAVAAPDGEAALAALLAAARRRALEEDCDLILYLDGLGDTMRRQVAAAGYRRSPETYRLILWPGPMLDQEPDLADVKRWRFTFADHDAF
ncbi:MAG: hypothetical protein CMJ18_18335 [Phycisphaeraceae bacterium]|nr:hypothetical protein [Phycisphaeraceae bacterium]